MSTAVIVDVVRTASGKGKPGGRLSGVHPTDLLSRVLRTLVDRNGIDPVLVDDVIGGCVSQAGEQTYNITRNAVLGAGWPETVPATTVDRQCGSSQQAVHFAAQGVLAGVYDIVVACGVESMSRVPMGSSTQGADPFGPGVHARYPEGLVPQGISAELIADRWGLDREVLDEYSVQSHGRAAAAAESGAFDAEIVPITLDDGTEHTVDETVRPGTTAEALAGLQPSSATRARPSGFPTWTGESRPAPRRRSATAPLQR